MSRNLLSLSAAAALTGGAAVADVPSVAVDIAPVHSLVARVMQGIGDPELIVQPGASPHEYSLRPSDASALQDAELVFWMGEGLTPWMQGALETLATNASVTTLLEADETALLEVREGTLFDAHGHAEPGGESHDDGDKHDHDAHHHDDHADRSGHDHGAHDPHAWLSAKNASAWLDVIAGRLADADPDNADAYLANAAAARHELATLAAQVKDLLDPVRGGSFIVFHDAYQYFETDFDLPAAGAISLGDASEPSPARIAEIQERIRAEGVDCVLAEPQFNPGLVATVLDGTQAKTGVMDPLGAALEPGPALYPQLISNMAQTLAECL